MMDTKLKCQPPGPLAFRMGMMCVSFAITVFWIKSVGRITFPALWQSGVSTLVMVGLGVLPYFYAYSREKKLLNRALAEELCWGCLYSLKGCPEEDSLCPECGLPRPGSKERWSLWQPTFIAALNGVIERERAARIAQKKAARDAKKRAANQ
jgi:hypothetical protein